MASPESRKTVTASTSNPFIALQSASYAEKASKGSASATSPKASPSSSSRESSASYLGREITRIPSPSLPASESTEWELGTPLNRRLQLAHSALSRAYDSTKGADIPPQELQSVSSKLSSALGQTKACLQGQIKTPKNTESTSQTVPNSQTVKELHDLYGILVPALQNNYATALESLSSASAPLEKKEKGEHKPLAHPNSRLSEAQTKVDQIAEQVKAEIVHLGKEVRLAQKHPLPNDLNFENLAFHLRAVGDRQSVISAINESHGLHEKQRGMYLELRNTWNEMLLNDIQAKELAYYTDKLLPLISQIQEFRKKSEDLKKHFTTLSGQITTLSANTQKGEVGDNFYALCKERDLVIAEYSWLLALRKDLHGMFANLKDELNNQINHPKGLPEKDLAKFAVVDEELQKEINTLVGSFQQNRIVLRDKLITVWNSLVPDFTHHSAELDIVKAKIKLLPQCASLETKYAQIEEFIRETRKGKKERKDHVEALKTVTKDFEELSSIIKIGTTTKQKKYADNDTSLVESYISTMKDFKSAIQSQSQPTLDHLKKNMYLFYDENSKASALSLLTSSQNVIMSRYQNSLAELDQKWSANINACATTIYEIQLVKDTLDANPEGGKYEHDFTHAYDKKTVHDAKEKVRSVAASIPGLSSLVTATASHVKSPYEALESKEQKQ